MRTQIIKITINEIKALIIPLPIGGPCSVAFCDVGLAF